MSTINNTPRMGTSGNLGPLSIKLAKYAATLALGIGGTLFYQGNLVSLREYNQAALLRTTAYNVVSQSGSTATGGLKSGPVGNYNAIFIKTPFNATDAAANGVQAGSGILTYAQIDAIAPQGSNTITCSVANNSVRGTGGTTVIPRTTIGTGTIVVRSTGAFLVGPTESFRCSLGSAPSASFNAKALLQWTQSRVSN